MEETAWQCGKRRASELANGRGIIFMIVCAPIFAVGGLFVLTSLSWPLRVLAAVLVGLVVALAASFLISAAYALHAPYKQRDEARDQVRVERERFDEAQVAYRDSFDAKFRETEDLRGQLVQARNERVAQLEELLAAAEHQLGAQDRRAELIRQLEHYAMQIDRFRSRSEMQFQSEDESGRNTNVRKLVEDAKVWFDQVETTLREQGEEFGLMPHNFEQDFDLEYNPPSREQVINTIRHRVEELRHSIRTLRDHWLPAPWKPDGR